MTPPTPIDVSFPPHRDDVVREPPSTTDLFYLLTSKEFGANKRIRPCVQQTLHSVIAFSVAVGENKGSTKGDCVRHGPVSTATQTLLSSRARERPSVRHAANKNSSNCQRKIIKKTIQLLRDRYVTLVNSTEQRTLAQREHCDSHVSSFHRDIFIERNLVSVVSNSERTSDMQWVIANMKIRASVDINSGSGGGCPRFDDRGHPHSSSPPPPFVPD